jgi:hypothetical protein
MHAYLCLLWNCSTSAETCSRFCINCYYYMSSILTIFHSRFYIAWLGKLIDMCQIFRKRSSYWRLWVQIVFIVSHVCQSEELCRLPRNNFCMTIFVYASPSHVKFMVLVITVLFCTMNFCLRGFYAWGNMYNFKKQGPTGCLYQTYFIAI